MGSTGRSTVPMFFPVTSLVTHCGKRPPAGVLPERDVVHDQLDGLWGAIPGLVEVRQRRSVEGRQRFLNS